MCDCITQVTEKIIAAEAIKANRPPRTIFPLEEFDGTVGLQNQYFTLGANSDFKLYTPFIYRYTFKKANGKTSLPKKETINMYFTYCPFCGVKY